MIAPIAQMPTFAVKDEVIASLAEEGLAALDLKRQEPADGLIPVGDLYVGVDSPVSDGLLPENPLQLPDKNALYGVYTVSIRLPHEDFSKLFNNLERGDSDL